MTNIPKSKTHVVTPKPESGWFEVKSGSSGKTYVVTPLGDDRADCTCEFGRHARLQTGAKVCSHVQAVREWAIKEAK